MKSLEELAAIRAKMLEQVSLRKGDNIDTRIVVGMATCGIAAGARPVMLEFIEELKRRGIENATVSQTGCVGVCRLEPIVEVYVKGDLRSHDAGKGRPRGQRSHRQRQTRRRIHRRRAGISRSVRGGASYGSDSLACDGLRRHELFV